MRRLGTIALVIILTAIAVSLVIGPQPRASITPTATATASSASVISGSGFLSSVWEFVKQFPPDTPQGWSALFAGFTAMLATVGLVSFFFLGSQLGETRKRFRAETAPYLRVDLSPVPNNTAGTLKPPEKVNSVLDWESLNPGSPRPNSGLDQWAGEMPIYLWVQNQQTSKGGIADRVRIRVVLEFPERIVRPGQTQPATWVETQRIRFSYLEPEHINQYEIARVDPAIPFLRGYIFRLGYRTLFGVDSGWAHGSMAFEWSGGRLVNERDILREPEVWTDKIRAKFARSRAKLLRRPQQDD